MNCKMRPRKILFLRARDPSILSWNEHGAAKIDDSPEVEDASEVEKDDNKDDHLSVFLRIKGGIGYDKLYEIKQNSLICKVPEGSHVLRNIKPGDSVSKKFLFSKIFDPTYSQAEIFNEVVKSKVLQLVNGHHSTLLTYGASGSGKTYTIVGTNEEPGVLPRALEYLFRTLPSLENSCRYKPLPDGSVKVLSNAESKMEIQHRNEMLHNDILGIDRMQHISTYKDMQYRLSSEPAGFTEENENLVIEIWISFAEIYNEQIYDLLQPDPPRGQNRPKLRLATANEKTYIKNLSCVNVSSGLEAYQILQYGLHNLNYASTLINSHSSRSHSIFTLKLVQVSKEDKTSLCSNFNFCDLAGSERLKKTLNIGERLKESNNINTSLLVLGRCIKAIRNSQKGSDNTIIPFRESKLTQLFQKALSGKETICMIVNINPSRDMFDESQHVLNFSAIAKDIAVIPQNVNRPNVNNRFSQCIQGRSTEVAPGFKELEDKDEQIANLQELVVKLYNELHQQKEEFQEEADTDKNYIIDGYKKLIKELEESWEKKLAKAEEKCKARCQEKMQALTRQFEREQNQNAKRAKIIVLDSSDDEEGLSEENKRLKLTIKENSKTISELQQKLTKYEFNLECGEHNLENAKLKEEVKLLKTEKEEMKNDLRTVRLAYEEGETIITAKDDEIQRHQNNILELQEKVFDLEEELNAVRAELLHKTQLLENYEEDQSETEQVTKTDSSREQSSLTRIINAADESKEANLLNETSISFSQYTIQDSKIETTLQEEDISE